MSSNKTFNFVNLERKELEDSFSKISIGYSFVYIEDRNKYLMLTGLNDLVKLLSKNEFKSNAQQEQTNVEAYIYDLETNKFNLLSTKGKIPKVCSFRKCINIGTFVYCFGGLVITSKGEFKTLSDLYSFNLNTNEWNILANKEDSPNDRIDFTFDKIINMGIIYGGISLPKEQYFDDLWLFKTKEDGNWTRFETNVRIFLK